MKVFLTQELEELVKDKVKSGAVSFQHSAISGQLLASRLMAMASALNQQANS